MTRSILVGDVRTGRRITQIPVESATWSMVHRGPGEITATIPLGAEDFAALDRRVEGLYPSPSLFLPLFPTAETAAWVPGQGLRPEFLSGLEPVRAYMAVIEGDTILEAGPIWAWDYDYGSNRLTVKASGLWSLFDHRFVIADLTAAWAAWAVTYSGLSLGTIAKRVVELAETVAGGDLPIVFPDDEAGTHTRTYTGYDLATVRSRLEDLMGVDGGPDIAFEPHWTADRQGIEWHMRIGTTADPLLTQHAGDHVFDARVPQGGVSGISVSRDASRMGFRSYVIGSGMETARLMALATSTLLTDAGFPLVESAETRGSVEDQATLDQWAAGNLLPGSRPWSTWKFNVRADMSPLLGAYRPGDIASVWVPRTHPLLGLLVAEGFKRVRIQTVSGDLSDDVAIACAPAVEVR